MGGVEACAWGVAAAGQHWTVVSGAAVDDARASVGRLIATCRLINKALQAAPDCLAAFSQMLSVVMVVPVGLLVVLVGLQCFYLSVPAALLCSTTLLLGSVLVAALQQVQGMLLLRAV